jgi:hypothetical protein
MDFEYLEDIGFNLAAKNAATPVTKPTNNSLEDIGFNLAAKNAATPAAPPVIIDPGYIDDIFKRDKDTGKYKYPEPKPVTLSADPGTPASLKISLSKPAVKSAPIDTILFDDDSISIERMTNLIFEDIGGQELINIARNDIINGQKVSYQPIKNLSSIQQQYNPNNILGIQNTSDKYFANFSIKFENRVPETGNGPNGSTVYLDSLTGNLIIETINMENDEQIEVEITVSGILYEADFGEIVS